MRLRRRLGERGGGAAGRDGDGDRALAVHRRQDEVAQLGYVRDVAEHPAPLGVGVDAPVDGGVGGGRDHEEHPRRSLRRYGGPLPVELEAPALGAELGGDERHLRARREQTRRLLRPDRAATDHQAAPVDEVEAGHVDALAHATRLRGTRAVGLGAGVALLDVAVDEFVDGGKSLVEGVVDRHERLPLGRHRVLGEDRLDGALRFAGAAVDALLRVDHEDPLGFVDAVDGQTLWQERSFTSMQASPMMYVILGFRLLWSLVGLRLARAGGRARRHPPRSTDRILPVRQHSP